VVDEHSTSENQEKQTIGKYVQKNQTGWNLQYTFDERFCARVVTNEVQIYESLEQAASRRGVGFCSVPGRKSFHCGLCA
jgi:uncharacterized protein with WD repeat